MIDETENVHDVEKGYFVRRQPDNKRSGNHIDSHGKGTHRENLIELKYARVNNRVSTKAVLTVGLPKSIKLCYRSLVRSSLGSR